MVMSLNGDVVKLSEIKQGFKGTFLIERKIIILSVMNIITKTIPGVLDLQSKTTLKTNGQHLEQQVRHLTLMKYLLQEVKNIHPINQQILLVFQPIYTQSKSIMGI